MIQLRFASDLDCIIRAWHCTVKESGRCKEHVEEVEEDGCACSEIMHNTVGAC